MRILEHIDHHLEDVRRRRGDDVRKDDVREKGGGRRKRRTSYRSGRLELIGYKKLKQLPKVSTDLKKSLGLSGRNNKKRTIALTPAASRQRWRDY